MGSRFRNFISLQLSPFLFLPTSGSLAPGSFRSEKSTISLLWLPVHTPMLQGKPRLKARTATDKGHRELPGCGEARSLISRSGHFLCAPVPETCLSILKIIDSSGKEPCPGPAPQGVLFSTSREHAVNTSLHPVATSEAASPEGTRANTHGIVVTGLTC